ncbi:DUF3540 domain-containing protein [Lysobacter firmicutimachus]|uniref:DUF3540 domain-containing protein n=1 Tax=Lysobacter firmicutimachus TaxID=1792846 RepID=A0ABU8D2A2_9GAMM
MLQDIRSQDTDSAVSVLSEPLNHDGSPWSGAANVVAVDEQGGLVIDRQNRRLYCRRAHSCLTPPKSGDRVWIVSDGRTEHYVCAVLHRPDPGPVRLQVQGDLELQAIGGELRLHADTHLSLCSNTTLRAQADTIAIAGREARIDADAAQANCGRIETRVGLWRLVGRVLESAAERIVQASRHSVRTVETVDCLRSGQIDYTAATDARLHAEHTIVTASKLAKLDGEQVHIG